MLGVQKEAARHRGHSASLSSQGFEGAFGETLGEQVPRPEGEAAQLLIILGSLVVEASIPVLLCVRHTRIWGVILGFLFLSFINICT